MNPLRCLASLVLLAAITAALPAAPDAIPQLPGPTAAKSAPPVTVAPPPSITPASSMPVDEKKSPPAPAAANSTASANATTNPNPSTNAVAPSTEPVKAPPAAKFKILPPMAKGPVAPPPLSPRFLQVRSRIEALFAARNDPPPPPDPRTNPFRPPGAVIASVVAADGIVVPVAVNRDLTLLQQAVATLKVRGVVERANRLLLSINSGPGKEGTYKEGDVINVALGTDSAPLRVRQITRNSVTLTLNDAEMTLKF